MGMQLDLGTALFADKGFEETPSLKRSNAFDIVAKNTMASGRCRPSRYFRLLVFSGPNAEAWLDRIMASRLPNRDVPGSPRCKP